MRDLNFRLLFLPIILILLVIGTQIIRNLSVQKSQAAPSNSKIYVVNSGNNNVSVIDSRTNSVIATIPVGNNPACMGINSAGTKGYVENDGDSTISIIDLNSNSVINTIPFSAGDCSGIVYNSTNNRFYIAKHNNGPISVYDASTDTYITEIAITGVLEDLALNPNGSKLYVAVRNVSPNNNITIIDTASNTVSTSIPVSYEPTGVAINSTNTRIYVTGSDTNLVNVYDASTNSLITSTVVGNQPNTVRTSITAGKIYTLGNSSDTISILDDSTDKVINTIPVVKNPYRLAVDPNSQTDLYILTIGSNTVTRVDTRTNSVTAIIGVNNGAAAIVIKP